jgi:hypothetical protein
MPEPDDKFNLRLKLQRIRVLITMMESEVKNLSDEDATILLQDCRHVLNRTDRDLRYFRAMMQTMIELENEKNDYNSD